MTQLLSPIQEPPFQIYELQTVAQGVLQVQAVDGGIGLALSTVGWVDKTSAALGPPDGSQGHPFTSIQPAIDAGFTTILICPGDYAAEALVQANPQLSLIGVAAFGALNFAFAVNNIGTIDGNGGELRLQNLQCAAVTNTAPVFLTSVSVLGTLSCAGEPIWRDSFVGGAVSCEDLTCYNCQCNGAISNASIFDPLVFFNCLLGTVTSLAPVTVLDGSNVAGSMSCAGLTIRDSICNDVTSSGAVRASDALFNGNLQATQIQLAADTTFQSIDIPNATFSTLRGCTYGAINGIAGSNVQWDAYTASSGPPTGGMLATLLAPKASLVVNVPVLLAGVLGSVAVSTVGSGLEGIQTSAQVVASEPTAGVTGGGFVASARVNAANSITFKFQGPCTGGNQTFIVSQV